jgi:hypothetical protein
MPRHFLIGSGRGYAARYAASVVRVIPFRGIRS